MDMPLDKLRKTVSEFQGQLLALISDTYLSTEKGYVALVIHSKFGKPRVTDALRQLGGSVVLEAQDYESGNRYQPTFLGLLLSPSGSKYESMLSAYLEFIEAKFRDQPQQREIEGEEIAQALHLNKPDAFLLFRLVSIARFCGNSGHNSEQQSWRIQMFDKVDDLPSYTSKQQYIQEHALKHYDPALPVLFADQLARRQTQALDFGSPFNSYRPQSTQSAEHTESLATPTITTTNSTHKRFKVALSFAGENRLFVERVANRLSEALGRDRVLYDNYYEAEFARPDLDTYLQKLYHDESELIAIFLCSDYERKEWCSLEWRVMRNLIKRQNTSSIMPLRFDDIEIPGLFSIDGYVWIKNRSPEEIADLVLDRVKSNEASLASSKKETLPIQGASGRAQRLINELEPEELALVDRVAAKVLYVEDFSSKPHAFLNVQVYEEWRLGTMREDDKMLGTTPVEETDLLQELGLVLQDDYIFDFSVEGPLNPKEIHLSRYSSKRIFSEEYEIVPEYLQPAFVRTKGPTVAPNGNPRINNWCKEIIFDAWKPTRIGAEVFRLRRKQYDVDHIKAIEAFLRQSEMRLKFSQLKNK